MITLDKLKVGQSAIIISIDDFDKKKKRHLLEMGLTKKTKIFIKKKNNDGSLITIYLREYSLILSINEAMMIKVGNIH